MSTPLAGGVFATAGADDFTELRQLVEDIGKRSFDARLGRRGLPEQFDSDAWATLEWTGLTRLSTTMEPKATPAELAIVLRGLGYHAVAASVAETDLAAWLAEAAGVGVPESGPLTVAIAEGQVAGGRIVGSAKAVPWAEAAAAIVLVIPAADELLVAAVPTADFQVTAGHNIAGEPRDDVRFDIPASAAQTVRNDLGIEVARRGAWARCIQVVGALDAAAELSVAHTRDREQFGKPLSRYQSVQQSLATLAGEVERARATTTLAVMAAADYGFASPQADYAVTLAKVVLGRVVPAVNTIAHQLHGAVGVTIEHQLWSATNRAHSWIGEFGSAGHYARRLGRFALTPRRTVEEVWGALTGADLSETGGFAIKRI